MVSHEPLVVKPIQFVKELAPTLFPFRRKNKGVEDDALIPLPITAGGFLFVPCLSYQRAWSSHSGIVIRFE